MLQHIEHYFIIVSTHNVAEYRACLEFQPKNIYLVVTTKVKEEAKRLQGLLEKNLPNSSVIPLNSDGLEGENTQAIATWINSVLLPQSHLWQGQNTVLNMTGGTKPLAMMLCQAYSWSAVHYQSHYAAEQASIQILSLDHQQLIPKTEITLKQPDSILDLVRLYADKVKPELSKSQQSIVEHPQSLYIANLRLQAQSMQQPSHDNLLPIITPVLNQLWYENPPPDHQKYHLVEWEQFNLKQSAIEQSVLINFLKKITQLSPKLEIEVDDNGVKLPTKTNKNADAWKKWIGGIWFEQLIYQWLLDLGIDQKLIERDIKIARKQKSDGGETDIILFYKQEIYFIEIKADISQHTDLTELEKQLTSQSSELGLLKKVLIVTPTIRDRANPQAWEKFETRCEDRRVKLIIAGSKQDLANGLKIQSFSEHV